MQYLRSQSNCAVLANRSHALNVLVLSSDQYMRAASGGGLRCLFWKLKIGAIIFGKNCFDCFHLRGTFLISNTTLRVSRRKNSKILPCGVFLSCVADEMLVKVSLFQKISPALNNNKHFIYSWFRHS